MKPRRMTNRAKKIPSDAPIAMPMTEYFIKRELRFIYNYSEFNDKCVHACVPGSAFSTTVREKIVLETKDLFPFTKLFSRDRSVKTTTAQLEGANTEMNIFLFVTDADGPDLF